MTNDKRFFKINGKETFSEKISKEEIDGHLKENEEFYFDADTFKLYKGSISDNEHRFINPSSIDDLSKDKDIEPWMFISSLMSSIKNLDRAENAEIEDLKKQEKVIREQYRILKEPLEEALKLRQCLDFIEECGYKAIKQPISEESQSASCLEWPFQFLP